MTGTVVEIAVEEGSHPYFEFRDGTLGYECSGIVSFLTISKVFEVSFWIFALPMILSTVFLTYWAGSSLSISCELGAGFPFAAIGSAMILFVAIKSNQRENKSRESTGDSVSE